MPILFPNTTTTIKEVIKILSEASKRMPVLHLSPLDSIVDTKEKYIMTRLMSGRYSLKPNITQQGMLFRGDSAYHKRFCSRLERSCVQNEKNNIRSVMVPINVQRAEFELMIESFPLYQMLRKGIELPNRKILRIENPYGLAYAYDYPTSMVGLTSDLEVAAFYAVTEYNSVTGEYTPVNSGKGVLYSFELRFPFGMTMGLSTLGRQVFSRTQHQKTFLLELPKGIDFGQAAVVTGFVFDHDAKQTKEIYSKFDGGKKLAPVDDFLFRKIKSLPKNRISYQAFKRNLDDNPNDEQSENEEILEQANLTIDKTLSPEFSKDDLEEVYNNIDDYWRNIISDIYIPEKDGDEVKDFLLNLSRDTRYMHYFDLKKFFHER